MSLFALPSAPFTYAQSEALKAFLVSDLSRKADGYHPRSSRPYETSLPLAMSKVKALISSYSLTVGPQVNRFSITALDQNEGMIQAHLNFQQYVGGSLSSSASLVPSSVIVNIWFHSFEEGVVVEQGYQAAVMKDWWLNDALLNGNNLWNHFEQKANLGANAQAWRGSEIAKLLKQK